MLRLIAAVEDDRLFTYDLRINWEYYNSITLKPLI